MYVSCTLMGSASSFDITFKQPGATELSSQGPHHSTYDIGGWTKLRCDKKMSPMHIVDIPLTFDLVADPVLSRPLLLYDTSPGAGQGWETGYPCGVWVFTSLQYVFEDERVGRVESNRAVERRERGERWVYRKVRREVDRVVVGYGGGEGMVYAGMYLLGHDGEKGAEVRQVYMMMGAIDRYKYSEVFIDTYSMYDSDRMEGGVRIGRRKGKEQWDGSVRGNGVEVVEGGEAFVGGIREKSEKEIIDYPRQCRSIEVELRFPNFAKEYSRPKKLDLSIGFRESEDGKEASSKEIDLKIFLSFENGEIHMESGGSSGSIGEGSISGITVKNQNQWSVGKFDMKGSLRFLFTLCEVCSESDAEGICKVKYLAIVVTLVTNDSVISSLALGGVHMKGGFSVGNIDEIFVMRKKAETGDDKTAKVYLKTVSSHFRNGYIWEGLQNPGGDLKISGDDPSFSSSFSNGSRMVLRCRKGYFVEDRRLCTPCGVSCEDCLGYSFNCMECKVGFVRMKLESGLHFCVPLDCPEGYFNNRFSSSQVNCAKCDSVCRMCSQVSSNCTSCSKDMLIGYLDGETNTCKKCDTENGYYINLKGYCENCHADCKSCLSFGPESCLSCYPPKYLSQFRTCEICETEKGKYLDPVNKKCKDCISNCMKCDYLSSEKCLGCKDNFTLIEGKCSVCPTGHYWKPPGSCGKCSSECLECQETDSKCTMCRDWQILLPNNTCAPGKIELKRSYFENHKSRVVFKFSSELAPIDNTDLIIAHSKILVLKNMSDAEFEGFLKQESDSLMNYSQSNNSKIIGVLQTNRTLTIQLDIKEEIVNALLIVFLPKIPLIKSSENPSVVFTEKYLTCRITYYIDHHFNELKKVETFLHIIKISVWTLLLLWKPCLALKFLKHQQIIKLYLLIGCLKPSNYESYAALVSLDILKYLPNPFSILSDDKGAQLPLRFEIFGLKSHILDNLGQLIAVLILIYFTRILFSLILKYFEAQRVRPAMKWWLDHTDEVFLFKMFETYQISITFAICLHLKYHSKEAVPTPENSIITGVVWIMVISIGVFYFWFALFLFATPQYEFEESKISIVVKHIEGYCMGYGWAFILLLMDQLFFLVTYMLHNRPELLTACRIFLRIVTLVLILDMPSKEGGKTSN